MNKVKWIETALQCGFERFEIYQALRKERSLTWYDGQVDTFSTSSVTGTALRGIYEGRMVSYATEHPADEMCEEVLAAMREQSSVIAAEDDAKILEPQETAEAVSTRVWVQPSAEEIRTLLETVEKKILSFDERIVQVIYLEWQEETTGKQITNSCGMQAFDENKVQVLVAGAAAMQDGEVKNDYRFEVVSDLAAFDVDRFVKKLCENVLSKLGARALLSGTYPVILEKEAMTSLFEAFSSMFSGGLIGKGLSPLRDKAGEKIFSELITVVDDPRCQDSVSLLNYDDEGWPTYRKNIVEQGVFTTILHNTKSAAKMNAKSTGNGFKSSYASAIDVRPMNCRIEPGEKSLEELCAMMGDGLVITDLAGLHAGIDHVTTDFSLQCSGYLVKDGKRAGSVSLITIAANYLQLMKQVRAVGNDLDWSYRSVAAPSILFEGCAISGE